MFKTDACALCKRAKPKLENLSIDADIVNHNDKELKAIKMNGQTAEMTAWVEEEDRNPKGPVYVWEEPKEGEGEARVHFRK